MKLGMRTFWRAGRYLVIGCLLMVAKVSPTNAQIMSNGNVAADGKVQPNLPSLAQVGSGLREALETAIKKSTNLTASQQNKLLKLPTGVLIERLVTHSVPKGTNNPFKAEAFQASTPGGGGPVAGHPAVALLLARIDNEESRIPQCTATLISPDQVITAAHCVCPPVDSNGGSLYTNAKKCLLGEGRFLAPSGLLDTDRWLVFFQYAGSRLVKQITVDESYRWPTAGGDYDIEGDLVIMQLDKPVSWIMAAPVVSTENVGVVNGTLSAGYGWSAAVGNTSVRASLTAPGLKSAGPLDLVECNSIEHADNPAHICATFSSDDIGRSGICHGDSGGPLWNIASSQLVGTASGGSGNPCSNTASNASASLIEMRLGFSDNHTWILQHLHSNSSSSPLFLAFGTNLRNQLAARDAAVFVGGRYSGPLVVSPAGVVLFAASSTAPMRSFSVVADDGTTACKGVLDVSSDQYANWCAFNSVGDGKHYHLEAVGVQTGHDKVPVQAIQLVVSLLPSGTSLQ